MKFVVCTVRFGGAARTSESTIERFVLRFEKDVCSLILYFFVTSLWSWLALSL